MRLMFTGLTAALVTALLPAVPAAASPSTGSVVTEHYHTATSTSDSAPRKGATVTCPEGQIVYGFGGATVDGDGQVALVAILPNEELTSVTAIAEARFGWAGAWSVMAVATCWAPGGHELERIVATGTEASCPQEKILYSSGYLVSATTGSPYAAAVIPAPDLKSVTVQGGGVASSALQVTTVALCGFRIAGPFPYFKQRTQQTVPVSTASTTTAMAPPPTIQFYGAAWVFGAGVSSTRPGMFIDALGPGPALAGGWARMSRGKAALLKTAGAEAGEDDDAVTAYGICIGSWY